MAEELSDLIERTTVNFPRPIGVGEVEELFKFIAYESEHRIDYIVESRVNVVPDSGTHNPPLVHNSSNKIKGDVLADHPFRGAHFEGISSEFSDDCALVGGLRFQTIPGYKISEHNPNEVMVWDEVRKWTAIYFSRHKEKPKECKID